jgi:cytochrome bd-type quinol oxidase subunit 1
VIAVKAHGLHYHSPLIISRTLETPTRYSWIWWRTRPLPDQKWPLRALVCSAPLGMIAVENGWFVTELGRQPWIIYGFMRTRDAVTPMPGLVVPFTTFTIVYLLLAVIVIFLLRRQFMETQPRWIKKGTFKEEPASRA